MRTRERIIVSFVMFIINLPLFSDKQRGYFFNKIFKNLIFDDNVFIRRNVTLYGKNELIIGKNSFINEECFVDLSSKIVIGDDVAIGMRTIILSSSHEIGRRRCGIAKRKITKIENNVWIGAGVIIHPGVCIGEGSVISAGEVIRTNIPKNVILKNGNITKIDESRFKNV